MQKWAKVVQMETMRALVSNLPNLDRAEGDENAGKMRMEDKVV